VNFMKFGLNQATLKTSPIETLISAAGDGKFDGVELCQENVVEYLLHGSYTTLRDTLESYQLAVASVNALEDFNLCSDFDFKTKILSQLQFMCEIAYKLESDLLIAVPSFLREDANPADVREDKIILRTQKRLIEVARVAGRHDLNVGLEFLAFPNASVRSLALARKIVDPLVPRLENVGNVVDTFHFLISKGDVHDLVGISCLSIIHIGDVSYTAGEDLSHKIDQDRVLPGEGNFEFAGFFTLLNTTKYRGYISVELSDQTSDETSPLEVAKKARASLSMFATSP
jgi:sugar phosphate isomerase/epimerase